MSASVLSMVLKEQPYDRFLLKQSGLYRRSRALFLKQGGKYQAAVLSSPRSLGSLTLIENKIEYSPIETELVWSRRDRLQRRDDLHATLLRGFVTNVFHEQSHRILWKFLEQQRWGCPSTSREAYRYLNFIESLVVCLDMALGDELKRRDTDWLYDAGVIYNPGSGIQKSKISKRDYRNALQVALHATFLRLEGLHVEDIERAIETVFSNVPERLRKPACQRALKLDDLFVEMTNPIWQKKHVKKVIRAMAPGRQGRSARALVLPIRKPLDHIQGYMIGEKWFELFGL